MPRMLKFNGPALRVPDPNEPHGSQTRVLAANGNDWVVAQYDEEVAAVDVFDPDLLVSMGLVTESGIDDGARGKAGTIKRAFARLAKKLGLGENMTLAEIVAAVAALEAEDEALREARRGERRAQEAIERALREAEEAARIEAEERARLEAEAAAMPEVVEPVIDDQTAGQSAPEGA